MVVLLIYVFAIILHMLLADAKELDMWSDQFSTVAAGEKEEAAITLVKESLLLMLKNLDKDKSGEISRAEFEMVIEDQEALEVLRELQVDVLYLMEMQDMLFH